jgi:lysylphosphatidylglycerol synthetase-like protein (DUF2156 family)
MAKSDALVYFVAGLLGICAGLLETKLGDVLITSLFVLVSTLALGFVRSRRAWRWILIVGAGVPIVQIAAYLLLTQRPYRAQIWESGLGFVTGTAGCYCGAFGRKAIDELFMSKKS